MNETKIGRKNYNYSKWEINQALLGFNITVKLCSSMEGDPKEKIEDKCRVKLE